MSGERPGDRELLRAAVERSRHSPVSSGAYSVGAVVVTADGRARAAGHSRQVDPLDHAEEVALGALVDAGHDPTGGTVYSSLEPCSSRRSRPRTCTGLILDAGIARVVFALREPPLLADCHGAELLAAGGVEVIELTDLAAAVRAVNGHLLDPG